MHFTVLVFHKEDESVDDLLEPYSEDITVAPHIVWTREEAIKEARTYEKFKTADDEECWQFMAEDMITDRKGNIYSKSNPAAHYDWYKYGDDLDVVDRILRLKSTGEYVGSAKLKDIDFDVVGSKLYQKYLREWDVVVNKQPMQDDDDDRLSFYASTNGAIDWAKNYQNTYKTAENFATIMASVYAWNVVNPDGIWEDLSETFSWTDTMRIELIKYIRTEYIERLDPETVLTIVDCHM